MGRDDPGLHRVERPPNASQTTCDREDDRLEEGRIKPRKAQPRFVIANGDQDIAEATAHHPTHKNPSRDHHQRGEPEEAALHLRRSHHLSKQLGHIGLETVGAVDQFLLAVEEVEKDQQGRLGQDREVDPFDAVAKHQVAEYGRQNGRDQPDRHQGEQGRMEGLPKRRKLLHAIEAEELRNAIGETRRAIELQIHRRGIAAQGKKDPLPQAEQPGETPDQINAQGNNRQREETAQQVETKHGQDRGCRDDRGNDQHPQQELRPARLLKTLKHRLRPPPCVPSAGRGPRDGTARTERSGRRPSPAPCSSWRRTSPSRPAEKASQARASADDQHRSDP